MADRFTVKFEGGTKFEDMLATLPEKIENKILQKATIEALRIAGKAIKAAAPMHTALQSKASRKYGTLKSNIKVKASKSRAQKGQRAAHVTTGKAFWGFFYEKGTVRQPARPWFLPAFTASVEAMTKKLGDSIGAAIEKEWKK